MKLRRSEERGQGNYGWLKARYSFSFAHYMNPNAMGFRSLRVLNEDRVAAGQGFPVHGHRDMEILTWVLEGRLRHSDSEGNESVLLPGRIQRMTAGRGIRHSEMNDSESDELHLLQIWIEPAEEGLEPGWEELSIPVADQRNRWHKAASSRPEKGKSVLVRQDMELFIARLDAGQALHHDLESGRGAYIQLARGEVRVGDHRLKAGDAATIDLEAQKHENGTRIEIEAEKDAEILLFDLG